MAEVRLHTAVDETLQNLPDDVEQRIRDKLRDAGEHPDRYLKSLSGRPEYRVRIGDYRAIIDWDRNDDRLDVLELGKREAIYD